MADAVVIDVVRSTGTKRLAEHHDDERYPLRMIGLREVTSHNSWMHNSPRLVPDGRRPRARIHPVDAKEARLADGDMMAISSASGTIEMPAMITDEVSPGTVAVPHGWGHQGGWQRANAAGGSNSNLLVSTETADVEPLAGMSILVGIPIRVTKVQPDPR
jgi:anaerobic selenocysteine-containing dehydrogenase